MHIDTHTCIQTHTHTRIHTHPHTHTHTHTPTYAYMRAHTHAHKHMHTYTHTQEHSTHTHAYITHMHACIHHTHTHTHTRMHTHTHTHTLTHTHTFIIFALNHTKLCSCKLDRDLAFHQDQVGVLWCSLQCGTTVLLPAKWRSNAEYKKCVNYTSKQFTYLCAVFHPFFSFHL